METNDGTTASEEPARPPGPRMMQLFIAVEANAALQAALHDVQRTLQRRGALPVRWETPAKMHITLQFLGDVVAGHLPALTVALRAAVVPHRAFMLRAGAVGAFPDLRAPRVLWVDVAGEVRALLALQRDVAHAVRRLEGIVMDRKGFRPHVTIGRVRTGAGDQPEQRAVAAALAQPVTVPAALLPVRAVALVRSITEAGGARYTVLERFPLVEGRNDAGDPAIGIPVV